MENDDNTPAVFLAELGQELKDRKGENGDTELAGILAEHILTAAPAEDCVDQALTAIRSLAVSRKSPPKEDADG